MNVNSYVKTLKGVIDKDDVLASLESVIQDMNTKVLPILNTAQAAFRFIKPKSPEVIGFEERYRNEFKLGKNQNAYVDIHDRMKQVASNLEYMRRAIDREMPGTVSQTNIDYRSAVLMQMVDNASFLMRFIRRFVELVTVYETQHRGIYEDYQKRNLSAGEIKWVENRFPMFLNVFNTFSLPTNSFAKSFEDIPNVKVDTESDADLHMFGKTKMDPFQLGFIPVGLNPFFHIGKWIAEFQAWRYKEAQEDLMRIQKRILLLEEADAGKANPKIEKEIEILRDKAEALTYKINKAEEDL
jgi:hypothetical protein